VLVPSPQEPGGALNHFGLRARFQLRGHGWFVPGFCRAGGEARSGDTDARTQVNLLPRGVTEGAETITLFFLMCLLPDHFGLLAWPFGGLCWLTTASRIAAAVEAFGGRMGSGNPSGKALVSVQPASSLPQEESATRATP
jgi:hypothetical protein